MGKPGAATTSTPLLYHDGEPASAGPATGAPTSTTRAISAGTGYNSDQGLPTDGGGPVITLTPAPTVATPHPTCNCPTPAPDPTTTAEPLPDSTTTALPLSTTSPEAHHDNAIPAPLGIPDLDQSSSTTVSTTTEAFVAEAGAKDDPHITNLAKEEFAVNQPGNYTLLRVPADTQLPPLLEVRAAILPSGESECGTYIREIALLGEWLGGRTVQVRSLRRNKAGSNIAGNETMWPFAVRISSSEAAAGEAWVPFDSLGDDGPLAADMSRAINSQLPDVFRISAFRREEFGFLREAETFELSIGPPGHKARIHVAQAAHQALNVELARARHLGATRLAGLLGTERHDPKIEVLTKGCRAERELRGPRRIQDVLRSRRGAAFVALPARKATVGQATW